MPALPGIHHQRRDDGTVRPAFFDLGTLAEVGLGRAVADELDVVEASHARGAKVERRIARRNVYDRIADRFPHHAAPACLESAMALVGGIGRRAGANPERVWRFYASEID